MPDYNANESFNGNAGGRKATVSIEVDSDVLAWFQQEGEPSDWKQHMAGVLRYYRDTNEQMQADAELAAGLAERAPEPTKP